MNLARAIAIVLSLIFASAAVAKDGPEALARYDEKSDIVVDHDAFDRLLGEYVRALADGRTVVDYAAVSKADHETLKTYIRMLESVDPTALPRREAFAYWANLYNAATLDIVLDNYPVASILRISSGLRPGPWKRQAVTVNGVALTLDDIEHAILRGRFGDNRVHYAVNCASVSCPNLPARAFRGATLEAALDAAARDYVNHPRAVRIEHGQLTVSSIYKWFVEDFGGNDAGVIEHLKLYAGPALREQLLRVRKIHKHHYNWDLNDVDSAQDR